MLLPLEQQVCTVQVDNDLIILISCQINAQVIPRLISIDVVEVEEGIMPASKHESHLEYISMHCLNIAALTCPAFNLLHLRISQHCQVISLCD